MGNQSVLGVYQDSLRHPHARPMKSVHDVCLRVQQSEPVFRQALLYRVLSTYFDKSCSVTSEAFCANEMTLYGDVELLSVNVKLLSANHTALSRRWPNTRTVSQMSNGRMAADGLIKSF